QGVSDAENIASSDETAFVRFAGNELDHLNDAPINTVDFLRELAGGIDQFAFLQMPHVRQFAEGLQLNRPEWSAKGAEIATGTVPAHSNRHSALALYDYTR